MGGSVNMSAEERIARFLGPYAAIAEALVTIVTFYRCYPNWTFKLIAWGTEASLRNRLQ